MKRIVTIILFSIACLAASLGAGYYLGQRSGLAKLADAIAGYRSSDLAAIELHAERIMGDLLRDIGRLRGEASAGKSELGRLRRERDAARAELASYYSAAIQSLDADSADYEYLRAIGRELESRYGLGD